MIDVERLRADTPGCDNVVHFNHAGASLPPAEVTEAVVDHLGLEADIGGYEAAAANEEALEHTYESVAGLIGGSPDEIALVESATRAWDAAFASLGLREGDRILTGRAEYGGNALSFLHLAVRRGVTIDVVPDDAHGQIDVAELEAMIRPTTRLISVTHCPSHNGLISPAAEVGAVARAHGITYLLDACQSAGQLPLDVAQLGCDLLSATGRKFLRGPRGTGFLWVRRDLIDQLDPPFVDLRSATWTGPDTYELRPDARRFETWEANIAGRIGLGVAVDYARALGLEAIAAQIGPTAARLRDRLGAVPGLTVRDRGERRSGIVTFTVDGVDAQTVASVLAAKRINVTTAAPDVAQFDPVWRDAAGVVRASVHYLTTANEVDALVAAVHQVATT